MTISSDLTSSFSKMSFRERFRGKCALIGKEGVDTIIGKSSKPIDKALSSNQSFMHE